MDTKTFKDTKADYMRLYAELGLPYRGESKDQMKFALMKYGESVTEDAISDMKTVAAPRVGAPPKKTVKVSSLPKDDPNSEIFSAKVTYEDPEIIPIPTPPKAKKAKETRTSEPEPTPKKEDGGRLSWNDFISLKAKEHPDMTRKDLMVKYSGKAWIDYKASFEST